MQSVITHSRLVRESLYKEPDPQATTFYKWDRAAVTAEHSVAIELIVREAPLYFDLVSCAVLATFAHPSNNVAIDTVVLRGSIATQTFQIKIKAVIADSIK